MNQIKITKPSDSYRIRWSGIFPVLILRKSLVTGLAIFLMLPVMAQREGESLITRDQISKISQLVKPLIEQLDKQLRDDETYKAYVRDIEALNNTKSVDEKGALTKKINENYKDYFQKVWAGANVDERSYQLRIKQVFPDDISKLIQFEPFLVFTLNVSTVTTPAPTEPPPPPDKCLDVCPMVTGEITGTGALIAGSGGTYGNCFLRTNAWSAGIGGNQLFGYLRNGITIPGTFPNDSRKLRVIKKYELMQEATSFAVLGGGYAETRARTFKTSEYMLVYSPVIFGASSIKIKSMSENYLLEKKDVAFSIFKTYAQTFSAFISGNWCYSNCFSIHWSMCEEK